MKKTINSAASRHNCRYCLDESQHDKKLNGWLASWSHNWIIFQTGKYLVILPNPSTPNEIVGKDQFYHEKNKLFQQDSPLCRTYEVVSK